ncbi:MAG: hypothetical protein IJ491_01525 [Clostridia bacterium]|nr:hypothetical protein [Clostridia bacterium]
MKFSNGAVEFRKIEQKSEIRDFGKNIPFDEYLYKEELPENYVSILSYGADTEGDYLTNTRAINTAITFVSEQGGGTVYVPEGVFVCSAVVIKSNVTLFVEGTLRCIDCETNKNAFEKLSGNETYYVHSRTRKGFIYAENAENITICGGGRIDGNGASYCEQANMPQVLLPLEHFHLKSYIMGFRSRIRFEKKLSGRVNLVEICQCENVDIHNIEFYESACWTCNLFECNEISIKNVIINNNFHVANTDGFDLSCCSNALVDHCYIVTGDDALCIKADGDKDIENITIRNCKAMSLANCFKIGTTVYRNVKKILVENCEFFMENTTGGYSGISIQSDCGGEVSDITVRNVKMKGVTSCFLLWLGDRRGITPGSLSGVTLQNIEATDVSLPSAITGVLHNGKIFRVTDVLLDNISITYRDGDEEIYIREDGVGYEAMLEYPEITRLSSIYINSHEESPYWELPVCGLYVRDCEGLRVNNFRCTPRSCNKRPITNIEL